MFGNLRERRWRKRLGRVLKKKSGSRAIEPWNRIREVAVYCREEAGMDKGKIQATAGRLGAGRRLHLLVYSDSKDAAAVADSWGNVWASRCVVGRKDFRFSYFPKFRRPDVAGFFQESYDLLLDLSFQSRLSDIAVLASVKAGFKVGKASQWGQVVNDLSLDLGDSGNPLDEILRLLESYLPYIGITQDRLPQGMEAGKEDLNRKGAGAGKPGRGLSK